MEDLTRLIGDANMNHEDKMNLFGDLPRGRQIPDLILKIYLNNRLSM